MSPQPVTWPKPVIENVRRLKFLSRSLQDLFTGRDPAIDLIALSAVCHEHMLLIGPPGTAKTEIITRFADLIDARAFHYLLTRYTEPTELFGPLDLQQFQKGTYHIRTADMLPEAQIVFLDEVFQGSSPILNSLLTILNERTFHNGSVRQPVPLICMIGAANTVPDDPWLQAFADRFVLRLEIGPVLDNEVEDLLDKGWHLESERMRANRKIEQGQVPPAAKRSLKLADLLDLHARLEEVDLKAIRVDYANVVRELRAEGVDLSDRRAVKGLKLIAGAALLREATAATIADFWPLKHLWNRPEEAEPIREVIQSHIEAAHGETPDAARAVAEILMHLDTIVAQRPTAPTEAARVARLTALSELRRELIRDYPTETEARRRVEEAIAQDLHALETSHV